MKQTFTLTIATLLIICSSVASFSQTWEKIYTGYSYIYRGIEFPDSQSLIGFAGGQSVTYNGNGIVVKTTDGGNTWTQMWAGTQQGVEGISFPDLNHGYICGWSQSCFKTNDGGVTWTSLTPTTPTNVSYYTDLVFKDSLHGMVAAGMNGGFAAGIFVTSDGGITWTPGTGMANEMPYKISYVTDDTYFMVTNNGKIQKSTDGGLTWSQVASGMGLLLGVNFYNSQIGIVTSEDGLLYKTYDGGVTWQSQITAFGNPLWRSTAWKNQNEIIMCGTPETVWNSIDGGTTWSNDYPASSYNSAMYDIIFTPDEYWYICGSQGYFYRKAPVLAASFNSNATTVCNGSSVQFTDQSLGNPTSWLWNFEGGTPSTSTLQNPNVTYSTPGSYNVSLIIFRLSQSNTASMPGYMTVESNLTTAPSQPTGPTSICGNFSYDYETSAVAGATSYTWTVVPGIAGTMSGTGLSGTFNALNSPGSFAIKVAGNNTCGIGSYSNTLDGNITFQPNSYYMLNGGGYCEGEPGFEIRLDDSDLGVDYQLFKDGTATGAPVPGTGTALSFGYQNQGSYTISGVNGACSAIMQGIAYVNLIDPPASATMPTGPGSVCEGSTSVYNAILPNNSNEINWILDPANAGTLTQPTLTSATIDWTQGFTGFASVSVQGQNECGTGTSSPSLMVTVNTFPMPEINGLNSVCKNQVITYSTAFNTGSTYTWTVTGGSIETGQSSNEITVLWNQTGTGSVSVDENSIAGCSGSSPILTVEVNECTGINENINPGSIIYPNPAKDQLTLNPGTIANEPFTIQVFDFTGQVVYQSETMDTQGEVTINLEHFISGTYLIRIRNAHDSSSLIFIVE